MERVVRLRYADGSPVELRLPDDPLAAVRAELAGAETAPAVRLVYAAAHVIVHEDRAPDEPAETAIDWPATLAYRRHLAAHGFAIAEAMDTAQRFALGWPAAARLIQRCGELDLPHGFVAGAGADQCPRVERPAQLVDAVIEQAAWIRAAGGEVILLPLPWLSLERCPAAAYVDVYGAILDAIEGPVYLHWLGPQFLPELEGYFPGDSFDRIMAHAPDKVRGVKLSLLDASRERAIRAALRRREQIVLTGDDLHFSDLIAGDPPQRWTKIGARRVAVGEFSHALLGIFDAIAEPASVALQWLARGDVGRYREWMDPAEALGQIVFEAPTRHYKAGLAFLAWLNGHQANFALLGGEERTRNRDHLLRVAIAAGRAGALRNGALAAQRLEQRFA